MDAASIGHALSILAGIGGIGFCLMASLVGL